MLSTKKCNGAPDLRSQTTQSDPGGHTGPGAGAGRETFLMVVRSGLEPSHHQASGETNLEPPPVKFCRKLQQLLREYSQHLSPTIDCGDEFNGKMLVIH